MSENFSWTDSTDRKWMMTASLGMCPNDETYTKYIERHPKEILSVHAHWGKKPTEEMQLAAVKQDGELIRFCNAEYNQVAGGFPPKIIGSEGFIPSENVQMTAVQENGNAIRFLTEGRNVPSQDVQKAAVQQNPEAAIHLQAAGIMLTPEVEMAMNQARGLPSVPTPEKAPEVQQDAREAIQVLDPQDVAKTMVEIQQEAKQSLIENPEPEVVLNRPSRYLVKDGLAMNRNHEAPTPSQGTEGHSR